MKIIIRYINDNIMTEIHSDMNFVDFIEKFFSKKVYISIAKDGSNVAINTDNVISVEVKK